MLSERLETIYGKGKVTGSPVPWSRGHARGDRGCSFHPVVASGVRAWSRAVNSAGLPAQPCRVLSWLVWGSHALPMSLCFPCYTMFIGTKYTPGVR